MPPVLLQVGVSLGFKGTGGGKHSKSRKRKNTNKTLKQPGRLNARGLGLRFTPPCLWRSQEGGWVSIQPALAFCIASPSVEDRHQKEKKEEAHSNLQGWAFMRRASDRCARYYSRRRERDDGLQGFIDEESLMKKNPRWRLINHD